MHIASFHDHVRENLGSLAGPRTKSTSFAAQPRPRRLAELNQERIAGRRLLWPNDVKTTYFARVSALKPSQTSLYSILGIEAVEPGTTAFVSLRERSSRPEVAEARERRWVTWSRPFSTCSRRSVDARKSTQITRRCKRKLDLHRKYSGAIFLRIYSSHLLAYVERC